MARIRSAIPLQPALHEEYGFTTTAPYTGEIWDLATNSRIAEGNQERIVKEQRKNAKAGMTVYDRLVETGKRLMRSLISVRAGPIRILRSWRIRSRLFAINGKNNTGGS